MKENQIRPIEAVADGMMIAYWKEIDTFTRADWLKDIQEVFTLASNGCCESSSLDVLGFVAQKYSKLFRHLLLIETDLIPRESWLHGADQTFHSYFLMQDKHNVWYAGSPANHMANKDNKYATTIFTNRNLESVISQIEKRDRIVFPKDNEITYFLNRTVDCKKSRKKIEFLTICRDNDGLVTEGYSGYLL